MRILLAEDEFPLSRVLVKILEKNNYSVDAVYDGRETLTYLESGNYDAVILDVMMPYVDGITILKTMRGAGNTVPVLMLSAKTEVEDRVRGLDSGANYYLTKPFDSSELLATLRVITRADSRPASKLSFGNVTLDLAKYELSCDTGKSFHLANKEFQMIEMLLRNPARLISTEHFMEKIWGYDSDTEINVVWVYISYLRKKLKALGANIIIKASRNAGYLLALTDIEEPDGL